MSAEEVEPGLTTPERLPDMGDFTPVNVGIYLDNIDTFSIRDSFWSATFYVWFRWKGEKNLDPAKGFQVDEARVDKREVVEQYADEQGMNYQRVRVVARISKAFNTTRVPLDDHMLTIGIEDAGHDGTRMRYVADPESNISSRVRVAGYSVGGLQTVVKNHTYRSTYGDPRATGRSRTFTEFVAGVEVSRKSVGLYVKLLLGLFAGVMLTLASFFIRPSDTSPRFSLPTASYFGAVANSYLVSSTLPSAGQFGMIDYVASLGLITIFACVSISLVSGYYYILKKDEAFSKVIDRTTRTTVFIAYLLANVIIPTVALISVE
jgi:hypothetical protein